MWRDLSAEQLAQLRTPNPLNKMAPSPRSLLAKLMGLHEPDTPKQAILLDFYVHTLQFGQVGL